MSDGKWGGVGHYRHVRARGDESDEGDVVQYQCMRVRGDKSDKGGLSDMRVTGYRAALRQVAMGKGE